MRLIDADELIEIVKGTDELLDFQKDELIACVNACDTAYDVESTISKMETTTWIPCSEQEPNKDGYYLITTSDGEVDAREYDYGNGWGWDGFERIIAWMPLPSAWKGE